MFAKLIGKAAVIKHIQSTLDNIEEDTIEVARDTANKVAATAEELAPRGLTGDLEASIGVEETKTAHGIKIKVGQVGELRESKEGIPYSVFDEYGTSKAPAQPFVRPAADEHQDSYLSDQKAAIRKNLI